MTPNVRVERPPRSVATRAANSKRSVAVGRSVPTRGYAASIKAKPLCDFSVETQARFLNYQRMASARDNDQLFLRVWQGREESRKVGFGDGRHPIECSDDDHCWCTNFLCIGEWHLAI